MRKLVYRCTKGNATIETASYAQAEDLRSGGWSVNETFETIPEEIHLTAKQDAMRIKI